MKLYFILGILATFYSVVGQSAANQVEICREREGASVDDVRRIVSESQPPGTRVQKCFLDCLYQRWLGYSDGRRFLKEGFLRQVMLGVEQDHRRREFMTALGNRCDGLAGQDRCQLAADIRDCLFSKDK